MTKFLFSKIVSGQRDEIFSHSVDVENFHKIMPKQFKELKILKKDGNVIMAEENLRFLYTSSKLTTKHEIIYPDTHKISILGGPAKGTIFLERYQKIMDGTKIDIKVDFNLVWPYKLLLPFISPLIKKSMEKTFHEFIDVMNSLSSKNYH